MHTCTVCDRNAVDSPAAYACAACTSTAQRALADIADATPAARDVAARASRRGAPIRGHGDARLPINLAAVARLDAIQAALTTWARHIAEERGIQPPSAAVDGRTGAGSGDPLQTAARWLTGHLDWLRHRPEAAEAYRDIAAARRVIHGIAAGPSERRWLGQCGQPDEHGQECAADLYGRVGATTATCRACGARHDVDERRAWLDSVAREHAYTPREIEAAYGIRAGTIRVWAHRRLIAADADGRYPLGAVLDLAASEAARRATAQARRHQPEWGPDASG